MAARDNVACGGSNLGDSSAAVAMLRSLAACSFYPNGTSGNSMCLPPPSIAAGGGEDRNDNIDGRESGSVRSGGGCGATAHLSWQAVLLLTVAACLRALALLVHGSYAKSGGV